MRIYRHESVLEAARARVAWLFDEFQNVVVNFSGGKDSTVVLNLALEEAERRGRLPLPVVFIDQEMEWQATIDLVEQVMLDPRVEPRWYQVPFLFPNSASQDAWISVWDPELEDRWMRPKHPIAIHDYPFDKPYDFYKMFPAIVHRHSGDMPTATIGGVRAEESPGRTMGVTMQATYKWATWGTISDRKRGHYNFYPIYDWGYRDVWKAIHSHGWSYCSIYDKMYQYGYYIQDMRVSNLHHETALTHLQFLQEIEPRTWERLTRRLPGMNTVKHLGTSAFTAPKQLPFMFADWREYRDYLLPRLVSDDKIRANLAAHFARLDKKYARMRRPEARHKVEIASILVQDGDVMTKIKNWEASPAVATWRKYDRGDQIPLKHLQTNPYING